MRERGYRLTCQRCERKEFVLEDKLKSWKGLVLKKYGDEPLDLCPTCSELFDKLAGYFISGYKSGIRMYLEDGTPIIFTPKVLKSDKTETKMKVEDPVEEKTIHTTSTATFKMAYLTDLDEIHEYKGPSLLDKKFTIGQKKEEEDDDAN